MDMEAGPLQEAFKKLAYPDENIRPMGAVVSTAGVSDHMQQVLLSIIALWECCLSKHENFLHHLCKLCTIKKSLALSIMQDQPDTTPRSTSSLAQIAPGCSNDFPLCM